MLLARGPIVSLHVHQCGMHACRAILVSVVLVGSVSTIRMRIDSCGSLMSHVLQSFAPHRYSDPVSRSQTSNLVGKNLVGVVLRKFA